jgi:DNA-binding winged helix-turn-helix (wHTH) protein
MVTMVGTPRDERVDRRAHYAPVFSCLFPSAAKPRCLSFVTGRVRRLNFARRSKGSKKQSKVSKGVLMEPHSEALRSFGPYTIDASAHTFRKGIKKIKLGPTAFEVLVFLYDHDEKIVGCKQLATSIWGEEPPSRHTVQQTVGQIREALGDHRKAFQYIETVGRLGYRFHRIIDGVAVDTNSSMVSSPQTQPSEGDQVPVVQKPGFNLVMDGMIVNSVAELLQDDPETQFARRICRASYERSLEDFAFAVVYGSRIVTSKDFRPSITTPDQPGNEVAARLGEICERGIYPEEVRDGRLLHHETYREKIRADIERLGRCVIDPGLQHFFRDYMFRESSKHLGNNSTLFQEDLSPDKYLFDVKRPYYQDRHLQAALGTTATDLLIRFLPSSPPDSTDRYALNALREFATRNVLSLITIDWEGYVFTTQTKAWRLPHIVRALVRHQSFSGALTMHQEMLREIVVQHALTTALQNTRRTRKETLVTVLLNQRDDFPFKQVRQILEQEHLVFLEPNASNERKAKEIIHLINSSAGSEIRNPDYLSLEQYLALRRLRLSGSGGSREYESELYRVFPVLQPDD